jgi:tetratricopeptide (TPR) repeat protein
MSDARLYLKKLGVCCLLAALPFSNLKAADTNNNTPADAPPQESSVSNEALRAYLQLQEQLHATQLAIERNRQEDQAAAAQDSMALSNHLQAIEQSLVVQRAGELADNHLLLMIIGLFAAVGFVAALFTALFQWRAVSRLGEISAALSTTRPLPGTRAGATLGLGEHEVFAHGFVEQSNARLIALVEHLEKRIGELEHATTLPLKDSAPSGNGETQQNIQAVPDPKIEENSERVASLMQQGQSLLNAERVEEAIACFDEILAFAPNHAETLVKKGTALEKLRHPQEALECYDRAISADGSMTIAYLHKGGLCNRLERYGEAMDCYERALHTQEKKRAA